MNEGIRTKRPGHIKFYPERWIFGSTREELTNSERAVWVDLLCLAYLNDPLGQIDFTSFRRLAKQLDIPQKLLSRTVRKALAHGKIKLFTYSVDPETKKRVIDSELTLSQIETKMHELIKTRSKLGITLYAILILKWNEYQSEYLRQKPYREAKPDTEESPQSLGPNSVTQVTSRGEERKRNQYKGKEKLEPHNEDKKESFPSSPRDQFLFLLEEFSKEGYPFDAIKDGQIFDYCIKTWRNVDPIRELEKKIKFWRQNPGALASKGKNPTQQLMEFLEKEAEFQSDPSHRQNLSEEEPL